MRRAPHALSALMVARITAADARLCAYGQGRCQARRRYHPVVSYHFNTATYR
ncbi:hypothetical protein [Xanthomonas citri]